MIFLELAVSKVGDFKVLSGVILNLEREDYFIVGRGFEFFNFGLQCLHL